MGSYCATGLAQTFPTTGNNTSNTTATRTPVSGSNGGSSYAGAIAGGVVGGAAGLAIIGVAAWWLLGKRRRDAATAQPPLPVMAEPKVAEEAPCELNTTPGTGRANAVQLPTHHGVSELSG